MISITDKSRSGMSLVGDESRNSSTVSSLVLPSFLLCGPVPPQSRDTAVGGLGSLTFASNQRRKILPQGLQLGNPIETRVDHLVNPRPVTTQHRNAPSRRCVRTSVGLPPDIGGG